MAAFATMPELYARTTMLITQQSAGLRMANALVDGVITNLAKTLIAPVASRNWSEWESTKKLAGIDRDNGRGEIPLPILNAINAR